MTPWSDPVQGEKAALEKSYDGLASRAVQHDRLRLPPLSTALTTLTQLCVCCYALCAGEPAAEAAVCVTSWHVSKGSGDERGGLLARRRRFGAHRATAAASFVQRWLSPQHWFGEGGGQQTKIGLLPVFRVVARYPRCLADLSG